MLPLLPKRRTVYRWTCWPTSWYHPATDGPLLPFLRGCLAFDLDLHHVWQRFTDAVPSSCECRSVVQGLRCALPIHLQRVEKLIGGKGSGV